MEQSGSSCTVKLKTSCIALCLLNGKLLSSRNEWPAYLVYYLLNVCVRLTNPPRVPLCGRHTGPCREGGEDGRKPPSTKCGGGEEETGLSAGRGRTCSQRARSKHGFQCVIWPYFCKLSGGGHRGVASSGTPVLQMHKMYHGSNLEDTRLEISCMRRLSNQNNSRHEPAVDDFSEPNILCLRLSCHKPSMSPFCPLGIDLCVICCR